jgi:hypothetical protein
MTAENEPVKEEQQQEEQRAVAELALPLALPTMKEEEDEDDDDEEKSDEDDDGDAANPGGEGKSSKRKERLEQNRISARESRKRKKTMIEELQRTVITLSRENKDLNERNEQFRGQLMEIGAKVSDVQSVCLDTSHHRLLCLFIRLLLYCSV